MHWFLTPFLGSSQKHSSGCPCFQIPPFIHKSSYSSGGLHLLASPPQAFSSHSGSPKSIRADEGGGWMGRLAEPSCIFSKPNGCVLRVFWKPHSQILTSWPLFLKPTCPKARGGKGSKRYLGKKYRLLCCCCAMVPSEEQMFKICMSPRSSIFFFTVPSICFYISDHFETRNHITVFPSGC